MYGADLLKRPKPVQAIGGVNSSAPYGATSDIPDAAGGRLGNTAQPMQAPVQGNPQTFAQMRASGMARPAPPAVPQGVRDSINGAVANPSAYGAPEAMNTFNRLNAALAEQFGLQRQALDGQSARRGIYDSSLAVGQLGDLGVQQARAQSDLAGQIFDKQAMGAQSDRASANAQALQLAGQDQSANQFDTQQELARILGLGGLDLQGRQLDQNQNQFTQGLNLDKERLTQQGSQFADSQQLTRDQMLQQLAMFFGLPSGTDIGATVDLTPQAPTYTPDSPTYTTRPTSPGRYY